MLPNDHDTHPCDVLGCTGTTNGQTYCRRPFTHPVVVRNVRDGDEYVVERAELYTTALAAAIRSTELDVR